MKQILLIKVVVAASFLAITGCQQQSTETTLKESAAQEIQEQTDSFPDFLVGVWETDQFKWAFKFEPDGTISKLIHSIGAPINVSEGGLYESGEGGNEATYVLGPCEAKYDPKTRHLKLKIVLEHFRMKVFSEVIEGRSIDYFDGPISQDNETWLPEWKSYGYIEGSEPPDKELIEKYPSKLVFKKTIY